MMRAVLAALLLTACASPPLKTYVPMPY